MRTQKKILTEHIPAKFGIDIKTFSHTHKPEDLKAILAHVCDHFEVKQLRAIRQFLDKVQNKKFIRSKVLTDLLHIFALWMISQMQLRNACLNIPLTKETKICVEITLKIVSTYVVPCNRLRSEKILDSQRLWDYLHWQVYLSPLSPAGGNIISFTFLSEFLQGKTSPKIDQESLFLQLLIVHLCIFIQYSEVFRIVIDPVQNAFSIYRTLFDHDFPYAGIICSEQLKKVIQKIPPKLNVEDLGVLTSLFKPEIHYQKWGQLMKMQIPVNNACWKIIQQILENKLLPVIIQNQQSRITEITMSLSVFPTVLILLICEYYNDIVFLRAQTTTITQSDKEFSNRIVRLFYHPGPGHCPLKRTDQPNELLAGVNH